MKLGKHHHHMTLLTMFVLIINIRNIILHIWSGNCQAYYFITSDVWQCHTSDVVR